MPNKNKLSTDSFGSVIHTPFVWVKRNLGAMVALALMCILLSVTTDSFLVSTNILSTLRNVCVNCLIAFGITCVLICGGIDLSTQITVRGISYILTGGQPSQCSNESFNMLGSGSLLGLPIPVLIVIAAMIILFFVMNRTCFGRHVYAVGGNRESARYAGVNVKWVQIRVFLISGLTAALAGVVLAARLYSGQPNVGAGFERDAIAASVLGGTSMGGGVGTLGGTVIGVLIIGVLNNGMNLLRIDT